MAFLQVNVYSNVLQMEVAMNVILPQTTHKKIGTETAGVTEDVPVLYLLHGHGWKPQCLGASHLDRTLCGRVSDGGSDAFDGSGLLYRYDLRHEVLDVCFGRIANDRA